MRKLFVFNISLLHTIMFFSTAIYSFPMIPPISSSRFIHQAPTRSINRCVALAGSGYDRCKLFSTSKPTGTASSMKEEPEGQASSAIDERVIPVKITFETASGEKIISAQKGETLRTAMLRRGASPHNGNSRLINCRGLGTCGTCAVEINNAKGTAGDGTTTDENDGAEIAIEPNERNTRERLRLNFPPHGSADQSSNLRLACQVQVMGDIRVKKRTGFWGQDLESEGLAEEYEPQLWFGELEYILDNKSPTITSSQSDDVIMK